MHVPGHCVQEMLIDGITAPGSGFFTSSRRTWLRLRLLGPTPHRRGPFGGKRPLGVRLHYGRRKPVPVTLRSVENRPLS